MFILLGSKRGVVQDKGNSLKLLQRAEVLAFTIVLLCCVTSKVYSPVSKGCSVAQLVSAKCFGMLTKHPWCFHFVEISNVTLVLNIMSMGE